MLGFRQKIESLPLQEVVTRTQHFLKFTKRSVNIPKKLRHIQLQVRVFQDTIVVLAPDVTKNDLCAVAEYSAFLIGFAFLNNLFLRGAITVGEIYIDEHMILGKGIVRAYEMEQSQDWIGCWIDDLCFETLGVETTFALRDRFLFVPYPIPMKSGPAFAHWALNWPMAVRHLPDNVFSKAVSKYLNPDEPSLSPEAKRKFEHTECFLSWPFLPR